MPMKTLKYTYAAKRPTEGEDIIAEQINLAHKYYNKLIEIHRGVREKAEQVRVTRFPDLAALNEAIDKCEEELEAVRTAIRARNAQAKRKMPTAEDREKTNVIKATRKELRTKRKEMREAIAQDSALQLELAEIYAAGQQAKRDARSVCGVYFGTYLNTEAAVEAAIKTTQFGPPRFRRWDGNGSVGAQIQKGMSTQTMTLCQDTRLRMEQSIPRGKRAPLVTFAVRVKSTVTGKPVWARLPVYFHRPLPTDAQIMWATIVRRAGPVRRFSDGNWRPYYDWSLQLTIRTEEEKPRAASGACGIDLGWRMMEDGSLRIAYVVDDANQHQELRLPATLLSRWEKASSLQSIRARLFDEVRARYTGWLAETPHPDWMKDLVETIALWRSHGRLAHIVDMWRTQRFEGDAAMYDVLLQWRVQEAHLWQYERGTVRTALRQRKSLYEQFAAKIRQRYQRILVEDCDWREIARVQPAETDVYNGGAKKHMRIAAVGMLRQCLKAAGAVMVDAKDTTRKCHKCGVLQDFDHATDLVHCCVDCSTTWDQDENAARNLLHRAPDVKDVPVSSTATTEKGGRWARRKKPKEPVLAHEG